jgi:Fe2+ transport system protein FeoA
MQKRSKTLNEDYERRLDDLGFVWEANAQQWENMSTFLEQYKKREGHCNVPSRHREDEANLGPWVSAQRVLKKRGKLDPEMEKRLDDLGFVWEIALNWDNMLTLLRRYKEREGHFNVPYAHKEDGHNLGPWLCQQRYLKNEGKLDSDNEKMLDNLGIAWDMQMQKWEDMFTLLRRYKEREGHSLVPRLHQEDGQNLGAWIMLQRRHKTKGKLDPEREKRLNDLGFAWNAKVHQWESMYTLLKQYKEREGNCNVPSGHKEDGENLGSWVSTQRGNKKKRILNEDNERRLNDLGLAWDAKAAEWENMFASLKQYKDREGHCDVPQSHREDGRKLGVWLNLQRQGKKKGTLDTEKEERLEDIDVVWEALAQRWENMYTLLKQYKKREGHCNVLTHHQEDGENLGAWLSAQRDLGRKGKLDPELEKRLNDLGIVWDKLTQMWENMYRLLKQYKIREGHCDVPSSHREDGQKLGYWIYVQRTNKREGKLDSHREKKLEDLGIVWDSIPMQYWENMFTLLRRYKEREGHCNVPSKHQEDGLNLGSWVYLQRKNKREGKLDEYLERRLDDLGLVWYIRERMYER